jgi:hypothetical protein
MGILLDDKRDTDWETFHRTQEHHARKFKEMRAEWKRDYLYGKDSAIRNDAGIKLGYTEIRIVAHEFFVPFYKSYDFIARRARSK